METNNDQSEGYLYRCYCLHGKLKGMHYDGRGDVSEIEREMEGINLRRLRYEDLEKIRNTGVWNADDFGYWPSRSEVKRRLESREWDFWNLPKKEDEVIEELLDVFHQIELVSVVLRFIVPKHYGIISPPVENVLGIGPYANHGEKYKSYLTSIRKIRDSDRSFENAAQVDMALWVLQIGVLDGLLKVVLDRSDYENLRNGFERDTKLRAIRVGNLTRQLFEDLSRPDLAEALLESAGGDQRRIGLAGQIAGIEFERFVGKLARKQPNDPRTLTEMVCEIRPEKLEIPVSWRNAAKTRNKAIHLERPSRQDIKRLIEAMKQAEIQASRHAN